MSPVNQQPLVILVAVFLLLRASAWLGATVLRKRTALAGESQQDFGMILAASLTLLGLLIGFSFSMAIGSYNERTNFEEAEANAIGTEHLRLDFLPAAAAASARPLLARYTEQRIRFYEARSTTELDALKTDTDRLQTDLWKSVAAPTQEQPTPITALVVAGMNDVINSQGNTQAAWSSRIPAAAWALLILIAVLCNLLLGYGAQNLRAKSPLFLVLPLAVALSLYLIADIDSPRGGLIRVVPQNLLSTLATLRRPT